MKPVFQWAGYSFRQIPGKRFRPSNMAKKKRKRIKTQAVGAPSSPDWSSRFQWLGILLVLGGGIAWLSWPTPTIIDVEVSNLSRLAKNGQAVFQENCSVCHGKNGSGSNQGPPLIHDIYNPGHHSDAAFRLAFQQGVRQHHWSFGNMPPQPQINNREATAIIKFVREVQAENGISFQPHNM